MHSSPSFIAKPQVSLTVFDFFGCNCQSYKTNLQIYSTESQESFSDKEVFLAMAMAFNLILSDLT